MAFIILFGCIYTLSARPIIKDSEKCNVYELFSCKNATYIISFTHQFNDTLFVPYGSIIKFIGGKLSGPIKFDNTLLSGAVDLHGSSMSGHLQNRSFNAAWICAIDGKTDDAKTINDIIAVCGNVFFPRGQYFLKSTFNPAASVEERLHKSIVSHIGIHRSNVHLIGENGTEFITSSKMSTVCVYTKPYDIDNSVHDITIERIKFNVVNDGTTFHQWMHTVKFLGVKKAQVKWCVFNDFHGDAICLDHYGDNPETGERSRNQNIRILGNTIIGGPHHNNRNGISVINGKNVLIKGNIIKNTSRDDMPGGIDVEPNNSAYTIDNITIEDNLLENIGGSCGAISLISVHEGPLHRISIISNIILNSNNGLLVCIGTDNTTDNITIKGNYIDDKTNPYRFWGKGHSCVWTIEDNVFEQACYQSIPGEITVKKLVQRNNKKKEH